METLKFVTPPTGRFPCQAEGFISDKPFYFRQRNNKATLSFFEIPLGYCLAEGLEAISIASYELTVEPLESDAEEQPEIVMKTIMALLAMHEAST